MVSRRFSWLSVDYLPQRSTGALLVFGSILSCGSAQDLKSQSVADGTITKSEVSKPFALPQAIGGSGHRTSIGSADHQFPLVVVRGTPYEMGFHLGKAFKSEMEQFVPAAWPAFKKSLAWIRQLFKKLGLDRPHTQTIASSRSWRDWPTVQDYHCRSFNRCTPFHY